MSNCILRKVVTKPKPWGREIWFAWTPQYAGKILEINKGHRFSLQYHERKNETQFILKGKIKLTMGPDEKNLKHRILSQGQKIEIPAGLIHRVHALEKAVLLEVSSPELDDVVKLSDDYGRTGRGNDESSDKMLAQKSKNLGTC